MISLNFNDSCFVNESVSGAKLSLQVHVAVCVCFLLLFMFLSDFLMSGGVQLPSHLSQNDNMKHDTVSVGPSMINIFR